MIKGWKKVFHQLRVLRFWARKVEKLKFIKEVIREVLRNLKGHTFEFVLSFIHVRLDGVWNKLRFRIIQVRIPFVVALDSKVVYLIIHGFAIGADLAFFVDVREVEVLEHLGVFEVGQRVVLVKENYIF